MARHFDYIIVGSGIAGLYAALLAREHGSVLILTKGSIDEANTKYAQGGIAAAVGADDSADAAPRRHASRPAPASSTQRRRASSPPRPPTASPTSCASACPSTASTARSRSAARPRTAAPASSTPAATPPAPTSSSRSATSRAHSNVTILEHSQAVDIVVEDGAAAGVIALDARTNATRATSTRSHHPARDRRLRPALPRQHQPARRDRPTASRWPTAPAPRSWTWSSSSSTPRRCGCPACPSSSSPRPCAAKARCSSTPPASASCRGYDERAELAPRDIVARAIVSGDGAHGARTTSTSTSRTCRRSASPRASRRSRATAPTTASTSRRSRIPVSPAAHYMMGGVRTNAWGETNIAQPLRLRRDRLHRRPRRQPPRQQLAARDGRLRQARHRAHPGRRSATPTRATVGDAARCPTRARSRKSGVYNPEGDGDAPHRRSGAGPALRRAAP